MLKTFLIFVLLPRIASCVTQNPYENSNVESHKNFKHVKFPFQPGTEFLLSQGAFGSSSHSERGNEYSWDFDVPVGTKVITIEPGKVTDVYSPNKGGGCDAKYSNGAHNLKIEASDGTVAQYVHIDPLVKVGDQIEAGQIIAQTSINGFICQPQLHFGIYHSKNELYGSLNRKTLPLFFVDISDGIVKPGHYYTVK